MSGSDPGIVPTWCGVPGGTLHTPRSCPGIPDNYPPEGDVLGMESDTISPEPILNLGYEEFLTAVSDQPKAAYIPLCAELPLPRCSPLDVFKRTRTGPGFLLGIHGRQREDCAVLVRGARARVRDHGRPRGCMQPAAMRLSLSHRNRKAITRSIRSGQSSRGSITSTSGPRGSLAGWSGISRTISCTRSSTKFPDSRNGTPQETPDARFMLTKDCIVFRPPGP